MPIEMINYLEELQNPKFEGNVKVRINKKKSFLDEKLFTGILLLDDQDKSQIFLNSN